MKKSCSNNTEAMRQTDKIRGERKGEGKSSYNMTQKRVFRDTLVELVPTFLDQFFPRWAEKRLLEISYRIPCAVSLPLSPCLLSL